MKYSIWGSFGGKFQWLSFVGNDKHIANKTFKEYCDDKWRFTEVLLLEDKGTYPITKMSLKRLLKFGNILRKKTDERESIRFEFRVMRLPSTNPEHTEGDIHLFGRSPDHCTPARLINEYVGKEVVKLSGSGFGVNLLIEDMDAWSDYISMQVEELEDGIFALDLPIRATLKKRSE